MDSFAYRDITTLYNTQATSFTNPFASYATTSANYRDFFSQASAGTMSYESIFGVSLNQGYGSYSDPFMATGGSYIDYKSPISSIHFDQGFMATQFGATTHVSGGFSTPWTTIGSSFDTVSGRGIVGTIAGPMLATSYGISGQHFAFGTPTGFEMAGMHPAAAGQLAVHAFAHEGAAMDRILANQYMYTKEGMPYIATASYFNPDSLGSNYFFAADASSFETGVQNVGGFTSSYTVGQQGSPYGTLGGWSGDISGGWGTTSSGAWGSGIGGGWTSATGTVYGGGGFTYTGAPPGS